MRYIVLQRKRFRVEDVIVMLKLLGVNGIDSSCSDSDIIDNINKLSGRQKSKFNEFLSDYGQKLI